MALREEFETAGGWLFRWRSYLPLVIIGVFLLAMRDYQYPGQSGGLHHGWELFCVFVSFFGLIIRMATVGHTPRGTSGRNTTQQVAETLNTTGLYSLVRNPLYLGNYFMGLGVALFPYMWWLALIYTLMFWLYYERIIFAEEAFLRRKFGQTYLDWANKTPAVIPKLSGYKKPELPFSLRNVLKREYNSFFAVVVVMFLLEVLGNVYREGQVAFGQGWGLGIGCSFVLWLILRTLKKYTKVLHVSGR